MDRLTQNTFSQESFSPELNLKELVGDFREVSERDSVEVEKKENAGRNIMVCDNEVKKTRESRIPANAKVNTSWAVRTIFSIVAEYISIFVLKGEIFSECLAGSKDVWFALIAHYKWKGFICILPRAAEQYTDT